jgi:putative endonuclease
MPFYLYILFSLSVDKYYVGSSKNPIRRLHFYNTIEKGFTSRYRPWRIVFVLEFPSKEVAQVAERKVKSWKSREMIDRLIRGEIKLI